MKNYLNELSDRFEEEIEKHGITAILEEDGDVMIPRAIPIPNELHNRIKDAINEIKEEENIFDDEETKGCDQDHAERDNEL